MGGLVTLARKDAKPSKEDIAQLKKICNKHYPPVKVGLSVLSFGISGATRNKRRNDCFRAASKGLSDPRANGKPAILAEYDTLWHSRKPWTTRPTDDAGKAFKLMGLKTSGDAVRTMALGRRPPKKSRYEQLEWKATIVGGIQALKTIGDLNWQDAAIEKIVLRLVNDKNGKKLRDMVREKSPKVSTLQDAAEYIQREVTKQKAAGIAWTARSYALANTAYNAEVKRAKVESTTGSALSTTAWALNGTLVGAIIGVPLLAASYVPTGMAARTQIEQVRAKGLVAQMASDFENEVSKRESKLLIRQYRDLLALQKAAAKAELVKLEQEAKLLGVRQATVIKVIVFGSVLGGLGYVAFKLGKRDYNED